MFLKQTFLVLTGLLMGIFVGMVKLDKGGIASEVLAPVIADVPVLRRILPVDMQKKNASELASGTETAGSGSGGRRSRSGG